MHSLETTIALQRQAVIHEHQRAIEDGNFRYARDIRLANPDIDWSAYPHGPWPLEK